MNSLNSAVITPQGYSLVPESFQEDLIDNITRRLKSQQSPPCLLRAPTGSGKTFVLSRVLGNISNETDVVWFWFVPYVNLVNQTLDTLITNAGDLSPFQFVDGINQEPEPGQVHISTTQGVSKAAWRRQNYNVGGGELMRTPAEYVQLVRSKGYKVGVVVDEAHIALDEATEFGKFVHWLDPHYLAMATATPKSERINQFLTSAGMGSFESFNVSRDDVVTARLNKAFIEAVIYQLREATLSVANLKSTVLRQAWLRNQKLKRDLAAAGVPLTPLLLVQVENGVDAISEAERELIGICKVPPQVIGKHSSDQPDPQMMDAIANDDSKEVLIFKQSAGTGFDAPRAFVLASTKSVNDSDFAMQFIGRVMRVSKQIRKEFQRHDEIPADFNTAFVYLANAGAQQGYQQAIQITESVQTSLEGQVEKMAQRKTRGGATVITNRPTSQTPIAYDLSISQGDKSASISTPAANQEPSSGTSSAADEPAVRQASDDAHPSLFAGMDDEIDELALADKPAKPDPKKAANEDDWQRLMRARGVILYPLNRATDAVPTALKREERPDSLDMSDLTRRVATRVQLQDRHIHEAILAAQDRLKESERHTELVTRAISTNKAHIVIDRNRIAAEARADMQRLPQIEEEDKKILVETIASRIRPRLRESLEEVSVDISGKEVERMARTAALWLIRAHISELEEAIYAEIASQALIRDAEPLPNFMAFSADIALPISSKNLYGVLPPSKETLINIEQTMLYEDRQLLRDDCWQIGTGDSCKEISVGRFDQSFSLNGDEEKFAEALDRADFVAWWFRNPDKKPYSVRLVRGEHRNYFYPDFVVCLSHIDGAPPIQRLIETKHDLKDARRKAQHVPEHYGQVLFLTRDGGRLHLVTDKGALGEPVDLGDFESLREALQATVP